MIGTSASRPLASMPRQLSWMRLQKVLRRVGGAHAGIDEPDEIAEHMIAEDHADLAIALRPEIRPVGDVGRGGAAQGAVENAVVRGGPLEADGGGEFEDVVGNRAFGRPEAQRARRRRFA